MRTLLKLCSLACVGALLLANVSSADVVLTSVDQFLSASVTGGGTAVETENKTAPILDGLTADNSSVNGVAHAEQDTSFSLVSPVSFDVTTSASSQLTNSGIVVADAFSSYAIKFSLDGPYSYQLNFNNIATGPNVDSVNTFLFTGPGVNHSSAGPHSGQLAAGTYELSVSSRAFVVGAPATALVSGSGSLGLTAVPEPSSFLFVGLVFGVVASGKWLSRKYSRLTA